jgi:neutral trehalase
MDQGIRFSDPPEKPAACVDATSHVFWCRRIAAAWARRLGRKSDQHETAAVSLQSFIQRTFFCDETAWFHDAWTVNVPARRHFAFEGMWPMVAGAASPEQAKAALSKSLLSPERFNTAHPIATVGRNDPAFEFRMIRGPAWNALTLWAAEACLRYGRPDGARELLEKALDRTAVQFARTGTVWEFYHPDGKEPEGLVRKPGRSIKGPCRDYLGWNPLRAMSRLWSALSNRDTTHRESGNRVKEP